MAEPSATPASSRLDLPRVAVRAVQPADHAAIAALVEAAFEGPAEARLVEALRRERDTLELVAMCDGEVAGHVAASRVTARSGASGIVGIAPLAVAAAWRRRGLGARLMEAALAQLRDRGERLAVLVGSVDYYARFGFVPASALGLTCRWPEMQEHFQALEFVAGSAAAARGALDYLPAFDGF